MQTRHFEQRTAAQPATDASPSLDQGYREMALDGEREQEAATWLGSGLRDAPSIVDAAPEAGTIRPNRPRTSDRFETQIREVVNRNDLTTVLLGRGYNVYLPVYDRGVDLIAYREDDASTVAIQLKGRWVIDRKYLNRNVWIAFRDEDWFVAPHDEMVVIGHQLGYCGTLSWVDGGAYSSPRMSKPLRTAMEPWRVGDSHSVLKAI